MSDKENFKNLFKSLNNCNTTEDIAILLGDFFHEKISIELAESKSISFDNLNELYDGKIIQKDSHIIYPILLQDKFLGIAKVQANELSEEIEFIIPVLALKINNINLTTKIQKNLEFHNAMKNIAKIIETQYELNYIIPIIGEILDTFILDHLVYIFLKHNGKTKLVYPKACMDKKIIETVSSISQKDEYILNKTKKIGYFPLISEQSLIGCVVTKSTEGELTQPEIYYIQQLAKQISTTITRANVYEEILKYATLDALTGFYNRRQLDERIKQETASAKRKKTPLCAIMTDIDFFKKVNDTYGHATGDLVLKTVAKIMRAHLREYDIAARYGGEEFVILLPSTDIKEALIVAERLRASIEKKVIDIEKVNTKNDTKNISVTISLGVCKYTPDENPQKFLMNADKALYQAKESGRNQVVEFILNHEKK